MTSDAGYLRAHADGCTLRIRVQPGAKKTAITGIYGHGELAALKISVQAPPIEGRANEALLAFLAQAFGLTRAAVGIVHGETGKSKRILLRGLEYNAAQARLLPFIPGSPSGR